MRPGGELEKSSGAGSVLGWHELVCLVPASRLSRGLGTRSLKARQKRGTAGSKTQKRTGSLGHGQSPSM